MRLTDKDRVELLIITRKTIEYCLKENYPYAKGFEAMGITEPVQPILSAHCGAFVTLHNNGQLRGCIGNFNPNYELYKVVRDMAIQSSFYDHRFHRPTLEEMKDIDIEISVLTPFKKIKDENDIELGKHGIYMIKENRSGTFLPQVATETGWSLMEFLGHCAQDKMGMGWNDWRSAEMFTYEAEVFGEKELNIWMK